MRDLRSAIHLAAALVTAAGCSGGGKGKVDGPPIYTLSGTAFAAAGNAADGDTGDRDPSASPVHNDSIETAQALPSAVTLGGWVSSFEDPSDFYRATLAKGQAVRLVPAYGGGELDLELYVASESTTVAAFISANDAAAETIMVPNDGEYHVRVFVRPSESGGKSTYLLTIVPAAAAAAAAGESGDPGLQVQPSAEFVPGQVIVRFKDHLPPGHRSDTLEERARAVGLVPIAGGPRREMLMEVGGGSDRARAVRALGIPEVAADAPGDPAGRKADAVLAVRALRARADVESADVNHLVYAATAPDDANYLKQWNYPLIHLEEAWTVTTGTPASGDVADAVAVAVLDTGVVQHPDLAAKLLPGYDFVSDVRSANDGNGIDPNPTDPGDPLTSWHGTHVAGTIGAESNNAVGVAGVSWGATILPVRVLGFGGVGTTFDIFQGVRWAAGLIDAPGRPVAAGPRAQVINLSLGCGDCFQSTAQTLFNEVYAAGVVVVAAAGNDGVPIPSYPASYDHVVSVSAVDRFRARAPYSNFGPRVDVAAPGGSSWGEDGILSTSAEDSMEGLQYVYETKQGTSMAAPHVAGVVALMKDVCPTLGPAHVEAFLQLGWMTDDLGVVGRDDRYGWGIIDALASVETASAQCALPIPGILNVGPGRLDLDPSVVATAVITASRSGDGDLPAVTVIKSADWLTVTEGEVDPATKLGTYAVAVDPTADPAVVSTGAYSGSVTFAAGSQQVVTVPVTMRVGGGISADAGHIYFYLYDTESNLLDVRPADPSGGAYRYSFRVSPGSYFVVAGGDSSGDDIPLDPGESCGMYPAVIVANGDRAALDFTVGFDEACAAGPASVSPRWP